MREPMSNTLTVSNNDWLKMDIELNWDADLQERYNAFICILTWITFKNPEEDMFIKDSEQFYEALEKAKEQS